MQVLAAGYHLLIHFLYEEKLWNSADSPDQMQEERAG
jgi:hypothetical protein